jgi:hypothetical protein
VNRAAVFDLIGRERDRQAAIWGRPHAWGEGDCSSRDVSAAVKAVCLSEECGEVARAVLERDDDALTVELIQVAAIAVAWLEGEGA